MSVYPTKPHYIVCYTGPFLRCKPLKLLILPSMCIRLNPAVLDYLVDSVLIIARANCSGSSRFSCAYPKGGRPLVLSCL